VSRYVAFLRAINVGGQHLVRMDRLRELFESLKFKNVETFIASGNVIFDSRSDDAGSLERQIEKRLHTDLGFEVLTFVRSTAEVGAVAQYQPFSGRDIEQCALMVAFLKSSPAAEARKKVEKFGTELNQFHIYQREFYWLCRTKFSESDFSGALLEKTLGVAATMRNVTTVRKLAAKY
jgi:uncharacterized protein (DUF1697 family)